LFSSTDSEEELWIGFFYQSGLSQNKYFLRNRNESIQSETHNVHSHRVLPVNDTFSKRASFLEGVVGIGTLHVCSKKIQHGCLSECKYRYY